MGHRTMERPNLSGQTEPRRHVPRAVRLRRKRALRMASKARKPAKSTEHIQRKRVLQRAAKVQKPAKPVERSEQELVVDEAKRVPLNYLEDGVVEWGIKREGATGSGT